MIKRIENAFLNSLASHSNIASENREVYLYGLDLLLYTLLSTMGLIGLGLLWGKPLESVLNILLYYLNQSIGGGFNASSHSRCCLLMAVFLLLSLLSFALQLPAMAIYALIAQDGIVLLSIPLKLHPNKIYLADRKNFFILRSRIIVVLELVGAAILAFIAPLLILYAYCMGMSASALSRGAAACQKSFS